jgi:plasmid stability protein
MGDALAALGRKIGLTNEDFEVFDQVSDKTPAEPLRFE